ncbi:MAG: aspartate aminotransferase family protein [Alphaproteobacteria bacterium]|nr:aspartate aminotransferase family protein [Alphaproteobacteria bacterium]MBL6936893.1 aspartate aminotransferase family protein [Alphaproteobacteria bacterium]MBL7097662.1 aspartate aminotransferase family protein [Alphaproteobacteria bacterium]
MSLSNQTRHWQALDAAHHVHPFSDTAALNKEGVRVITRADGVYLWDSEGKKIIDGMSGLWCVQVGYGNPELAEAGYEALKTLPYYNHFFKTSNPYTIELAAKLATLLPAGHRHVLFANSGSEANDSALKLIRYYWNLKGRPEKKIHLSRDYAYHGVTMAAASLSGLTPMHPQWDLPLPGFEKVPTPYWYGAKDAGYGNIDADAFGLLIAGKLEEKIRELGADHVASFSAEPIQGAGGLIFPPATYWHEVQRICARYDVLLHVDEVITGFGRTGEWFGSHTYRIAPDIMAMAKGLSSGYQPISAISLGERMADTLLNANEELVHGYTYSGHPVACAVALKNLEVIEKQKLVPRVKTEIGPYLQRRLRETFADHPIVGEVRGVGLLTAIELVRDRKERRFFPDPGNIGTLCRNYCFNDGLICRAIRDTMVLAPPLIVSEAEVEEIVTKLKSAVDKTAKELKKA